MKKIAISACLMGKACRYDDTDNRDERLLKKLEGAELVPFCPEDFAFGTPRPTMDIIRTQKGIRAICNETGDDLSEPVISYAVDFFDSYSDINLFIGKDRSPSCGVCSAKCYNEQGILLTAQATGLMAKEAKNRGIDAVDAEVYTGVS